MSTTEDDMLAVRVANREAYMWDLEDGAACIEEGCADGWVSLERLKGLYVASGFPEQNFPFSMARARLDKRRGLRPANTFEYRSVSFAKPQG